MKIFRNSRLKTFIVVLVVLSAFVVTSCGGSKQRASGALKRTQYCERYREFDDKVATAEVTEQKKLLERITESTSFPSSLSTDYDTIIEGYEDFLAGKPVVQNEEEYKKASKRITRHAIDNCELLKGNSGSSV